MGFIEAIWYGFLMLKFDAYARSDIGKVRTHNEDAYGATEPRDRQPLSQSGSIYVVADGMGGRQLGEKASAFAVETLLKAYYRNPHIPPDKRLREVFLQVNHSLIEYTKDNRQPGERTGTTLLAAVVRGDQFWAASVGDSRLYLVREGGIRKITRDQVQVGSLQKHDSAEQEVRDRLSRIVGSDANLDVEVFPAIPLHRGDILLLCTDGLTRYATSEDILRFAHGHARDIVERLIKFANDCGGSDNITVSVIRVEGHPRMQAGLSPSQVAWIVLGVVVLLSILLLAFIGIVLWKGDPPVPTSTMAPTLAGSPLSPDAISTSPAQAGTQAAPLPGAAVTVTPALTVSPASSLVDCEFTVAEGNTTAGIAERFGAALNQVYRQDGTQQEMNAIRTGEILVIKEISIPACTNGGGVVPLTSTPTP